MVCVSSHPGGSGEGSPPLKASGSRSAWCKEVKHENRQMAPVGLRLHCSLGPASVLEPVEVSQPAISNPHQPGQRKQSMLATIMIFVYLLRESGLVTPTVQPALRS